MVAFKEVGQRLAFLEGDQRQQNIAGERQIECGVGFAMAVPVFLPGTGVAFVVVSVFHRPVLAHRACRALFFAHGEAGEEEPGVAFRRRQRVFFSVQSRWTVMAERAPGSPALTGEMAATAPRRKSSRPCSPS
jgi:hypothetical protein